MPLCGSRKCSSFTKRKEIGNRSFLLVRALSPAPPPKGSNPLIHGGFRLQASGFRHFRDLGQL